MPANLTQQYLKAEQAYRQAATPEEEQRCLEWMLREIPKHKGTDRLQADLKTKISRARQDVEAAKKAPGKLRGFRLPHQGAGRAVIVGGPNAGKSQLLASLTRATPVVAVYPFSTHEPSPGMMPWEDVSVQLVDTPPITVDVFDPITQGLVRGADLVLLLVDLGSDDGIEQLQEVLQRFADSKTRLGRESYLHEEDIGVSFTRTFLVLNKMDLPEAADRLELLHEFCPLDLETFEISADQKTGLEPLRDAVYQAMDVVRVYTKLPTQKEPNYDKPYTLKTGSLLLDMAELVHRDFAEKLKFAKVWGSQVHGGSIVKGDYILSDKDVVELHI
ncbi:GTPase [Lignipirellula cremea]|uniref:GTPase ObgE n=1 Tax=Lignipirellula cremea TaxID=2528010 RepID=A0A518DNL4_9BACT|nr:GTPase [Lignipirellula cremea]QDU93421.1 GTPase ObgE [Lignipirellula cremea]